MQRFNKIIILIVFTVVNLTRADFLPKDTDLIVTVKSAEQSLEFIPAEASGLDITWQIEEQVNEPIPFEKLSVTVHNTSGQDWMGIVQFSLISKGTDPWFYLPGFIYGTNRAQAEFHPKSNTWPRLRLGEPEIPYSSYFRVRSDRLAYPVAVMRVDSLIYGISGSPYDVMNALKREPWFPGVPGSFYAFHGFGCAIDTTTSSVSYTLGYENAPWLYICCQQTKETQPLDKTAFTIQSGEKVTFPLYIYAYPASENQDIRRVIKHQFELYGEKPRKHAEPLQAMQDLSTGIFRDSYNPDVKNYSTTITLKENGKIEHSDLYSISWTGGLQVATPLLMASIRMNRPDMRQQAVGSIQNVVDHALNPKSGLPFEAVYNGEWTTNGWWEYYIWKPVLGISAHSSYVIGQALYYILKAYDYEKTLNNIEHPDWLDFVRQVTDRIETTKDEKGEYPYRWYRDSGKPMDYDSFAGNWCLAARAYLAVLMDDKSLLPGINKSIDHYYHTFVKNWECYGTPLDTWRATEEEGILAFIKAASLLYRYTGDEKYLDYLQSGVDYEFSWKYCYNTPVQVPPLSTMGWHSSGASGTSISNPHVHPMGMIIADDILYLYEQTHEAYYKEQLANVYRWPLQAYNTVDDEMDFGLQGWMPERFCPHQGLLIEKYPDGSPASTWFTAHCWAASCVLEALSGDLWENDIVNDFYK